MPRKIVLELIFDPEISDESVKRMIHSIDNAFNVMTMHFPVPEGAEMNYIIKATD